MRVLLVTLTAVCLASTPSLAQDYTGTYTTTNATGGTVTLALTQDAQGQVTGTLSSEGARYTVEAMVEEGSVLGTVTDGNMGLYFSADGPNGNAGGGNRLVNSKGVAALGVLVRGGLTADY